MSPRQPDPRRRSNTMVLTIITAALLGGWVMMWGSGFFERVGRGMAVFVLVVDLLVLTALWSLLRKKDGPDRR